MLKIRLQRTGRKHDPTYRVVLTNSQNGPKSGKFIEILGNYDARRNDETQLKADRIQYWIGQGAQPSDTVHNLLVEHKVIAGEKRNVLPQKTPIKKEGEEQPEEAPATEAPAAEVAEEAPAEEPAQEEAPKEEEKKEETPEASAEEEKPAEEVKEEPATEEAPASEEGDESKEA